ncbi:MAG: hypothetical protein JEZ00_08605 [Anaerolineaceae bacterium]|nr:hypothetical protein [Anaerolineaceae bacterium]
MSTQTSPGGSTFPYYHRNGELHCLKYGSFATNESGLLNLMKEEEAFLSKPHIKIPVWVDFYETKLTEPILEEFLQSMDRLQPHIIKLALVGMSSKDKQRYHRIEKKLGVKFSIAVKFFNNPEVAKGWLVSEGS